MFQLGYRKVGPLDLNYLVNHYPLTEMDKKQNYNPFAVSQIQPYNPLYNHLFVLNHTNFNKIGFNHPIHLADDCTIDFHVKCAPLVDYAKYLMGGYKSDNHQQLLTVLPNLANESECLAKLSKRHNMAYVDNFFCYLASQLKHSCNMWNVVDYYGSYLAVQEKFKANITEEFEFLFQSTFFQNEMGKKFVVSIDDGDDDHQDARNWSRSNKKPLQISGEELGELCDAEIVDADADAAPRPTNTNNAEEIACEYAASSPKSSTASYSETDEDDITETDSEESFYQEDDETEEEKHGDEEEEEEERENNKNDGNKDEDEDEDDENEDENGDEEDEMFAYINNFPTQLILLEKCEDTLTELCVSGKLTEDLAASCLMQIVMTLIAFQKAFHFTHNDLHSHNIMYCRTDAEYLYYKFQNFFYRVPTYGYIFKIIDFGRAIYRFQGNVYASDCFAPGGDASQQYNTEPFFNGSRRRIDPNFSFDLCRLGCSLYELLFDYDETDEKVQQTHPYFHGFEQFKETVCRWCSDDNNKSVLYKKDGSVRYPGFKLYMAIARNVHHHTPQEQLNHPLFSQFYMPPADAALLNEATVRQYGLNIDAMQSLA